MATRNNQQKGVRYGGRPKGGVNKTTKEIRQAYQAFVERQMPKFQGWLESTAEKDPGRALELTLRFSEYFVSKLARTEITGKDGQSLSVVSTIQLNNINDERLNDFISKTIKGEQIIPSKYFTEGSD